LKLLSGLGDAAELACGYTDLGGDDDAGRLQLVQHAAKVGFGFAIAVQHRGVKVIHSDVDRPRAGALLVGGFAAHHQAADGAAAEAQHRELHPRPAKRP